MIQKIVLVVWGPSTKGELGCLRVNQVFPGPRCGRLYLGSVGAGANGKPKGETIGNERLLLLLLFCRHTILQRGHTGSKTASCQHVHPLPHSSVFSDAHPPGPRNYGQETVPGFEL